ncbi:MAG: class I SAM-dependent methyltransferase [Desulfobacterales bacterium]|nr:class I SAM-dependent methyltransferase [Desulfobacterales bacterium]
MVSVRKHYDHHLAKYYAWISGGVAMNLIDNRNFFRAHRIVPKNRGQAFDLGAGCGFQSIPLAEVGFRVVAMDLSVRLLQSLKQTAPHLPIQTICDDISNFCTYVRDKIELVVCMGDTLTHLKALEDVEALLLQAYDALAPGGRVILSFRNLSAERVGLERFIPVRSNDTTIFTCFLEYEKNTVNVHDIVYEKSKGQWAMTKSAYRKLRICPRWTQSYLQHIGFTIKHYNEKNGLMFIIAQKNSETA